MSSLLFFCRPILSRGETIDSCCSEDLVTVLEVNKKKEEKRPFKVTDRFRLFRKGIMAASLKDLILIGKPYVYTYVGPKLKTQETPWGRSNWGLKKGIAKSAQKPVTWRSFWALIISFYLAPKLCWFDSWFWQVAQVQILTKFKKILCHSDKRILKKIISVLNALNCLFPSAKEKFEIEEWLEVYLVIEEDGTEVDDEEYFSTLTNNTVFMLLFKEDIWSPQGPAYTWVQKNYFHSPFQNGKIIIYGFALSFGEKSYYIFPLFGEKTFHI